MFWKDAEIKLSLWLFRDRNADDLSYIGQTSRSTIRGKNERTADSLMSSQRTVNTIAPVPEIVPLSPRVVSSNNSFLRWGDVNDNSPTDSNSDADSSSIPFASPGTGTCSGGCRTLLPGRSSSASDDEFECTCTYRAMEPNRSR